jgi:ketosteroid isomerase-like protein
VTCFDRVAGCGDVEATPAGQAHTVFDWQPDQDRISIRGDNGMPHSRNEVEAAIERYLGVRDGIDAGRGTWADLAQFFTDDAVFIDPAWGRVEGLDEMKRTVFGEAMVGLEEWKFPTDFYMIDGDTVVVKWREVLPGTRADGSAFAQSGYSTLVYAGDGKFCYEEDLLNMTHVFEDVAESGFRFSREMGPPPEHPIRDFSRPDRPGA